MIFLFLLMAAAFFAVPLYVIVVTSFKTMDQIREIADGAVAEIETEELRKILGPEIAKQAEADFESPLEDEASPRHPEAREPRKTAGKVGTAARRGPREAQPPQRDGEKPRGGYINRKKRRHDRSGGPRPSRPR